MEKFTICLLSRWQDYPYSISICLELYWRRLVEQPSELQPCHFALISSLPLQIPIGEFT